MPSYKLAPNGVYRDFGTADQMFIPNDVDNLQWQEYQAWIGTGGVPDPDDSPPLAGPRHITRLAFRNRFTREEKVAIELASLDDPTLPISDPSRQIAATIRVDLKDVDNSRYIDLDRADTVAGVNAFVALGILTPQRAGEIINNPVQDYERPDNALT